MNDETWFYGQEGDAICVSKNDEGGGVRLGVQITGADGERRAAIIVQDDEPKGGRAGDVVAGEFVPRTADGRPQWHTVVGVMPPRGAGPPQVMLIFEGAVMPVMSGNSDWFPDGSWSHPVETTDPGQAAEVAVAKQQQVWLERNGGYGPRPSEEPSRAAPGWERYPLPKTPPAGYGDDADPAGAWAGPQVEQVNVGNPYDDGQAGESAPFDGPGAQTAWGESGEFFSEQPEPARAAGGRRWRR